MDKLVLSPYWLRWTPHWDSVPAWLAKHFPNPRVCGVSWGRLGGWVCSQEEVWEQLCKCLWPLTLGGDQLSQN